MAKREFSVWISRRPSDKKITRFWVGDAIIDTKEVDERPSAAEFPVSVLYDEETQRENALRYAEYLNKLAEASRVAHEQIHLVDILSRP